MNEDEVYTMVKEHMKEMREKFTISEPPRYRFNWLRQKWFEFWNPEPLTLREFRGLRKFFRAMCVVGFFSILYEGIVNGVESVLPIIFVFLIMIPLFEWRVKVNIRELEMIE